ncbi:MAG: hypothetical protein ACREX1_03865, partial [Advenella sp.]
VEHIAGSKHTRASGSQRIHADSIHFSIVIVIMAAQKKTGGVPVFITENGRSVFRYPNSFGNHKEMAGT